tara:strand:- start:613 stop:774 length:162 start_codon:yes stop_codon:yes gene_type:complete
MGAIFSMSVCLYLADYHERRKKSPPQQKRRKKYLTAIPQKHREAKKSIRRVYV